MRLSLIALTFILALPLASQADGGDNPVGATQAGQMTKVMKVSSSPLQFNGRLHGTFTQCNANITNQFTSPDVQTLTLGNNTYKVQIGPFSLPDKPSLFERLFFPDRLPR
jgi:hypothetical protein